VYNISKVRRILKKEKDVAKNKKLKHSKRLKLIIYIYPGTGSDKIPSYGSLKKTVLKKLEE